MITGWAASPKSGLQSLFQPTLDPAKQAAMLEQDTDWPAARVGPEAQGSSSLAFWSYQEAWVGSTGGQATTGKVMGEDGRDRGSPV